MFPVGGVAVMLAGAAVAGVVCVLLAWALTPRVGRFAAWSQALLLWSVIVLGLITLLPADGAPGIVSAEGRLDHCSFDIGGPAPDGFWIFGGGQRLLNVVVFVPSGLLLVLVAARWRRAALVLVPLGVVALAGYSVAIELTQLALARLDRACDVTDMIDNATGAALGAALGVVVALAVRPWRFHRANGTAGRPAGRDVTRRGR